MITSRDIKDLLPRTQDKANKLIQHCKEAGIDLLVTATFRDNEAQNALYAKGRSVVGKRVTNVRGGDSFHNYRVALDVVPIVDGKCIWDDMTLWARVGAIGVQCGLNWGGYWNSFPDKPHFQDENGYTIEEYKSGKVPG